MAWRGPFIEQLRRPLVAPVFLFESHQFVESTSGVFAGAKDPMALSSARIPGFHSRVCIELEGCSIVHPTLTPGAWNRSYGSLTIGVTPGVDVRRLCARGQAVTLSMGFSGWRRPHFETIWLGFVRGISNRAGQWQIECIDAPGGLQNRFSDQQDEQNLFYNLGHTTLSADYEVGVDTTIDVTASSSWEYGDDDGYLLYITPTTGDPYYVGADTLTVLTFGTLNETPRFDTTPVDAVSGDRVDTIAYLVAHPIHIAARILASSGTASLNGVYDVYPASWGYGISRGHLDENDASWFASLTGGTNLTWQVLVDDPQSDAMGWLQGVLQQGGFFVSVHQGALTVRAVGTTETDITPGMVTLDHDQIASLDYETWDSESPIEYRTSKAVGASTSETTATVSDATLSTRPSKANRRRDLLHVWDLDTGAWTAEVSARLAVWDTTVPERMTIRTSNWAAAVASVGDYVAVTTTLVDRRSGADFLSTRGLMIGGGPDWFRGGCSIDVLFPGED